MKASTKIKSLAIAALTILCTGKTIAQETTTITPDGVNYDQGFRLGFGVNAGYVNDDLYDWSLGGDVRIQYDFSKRTSITLTTGFTNMFIGDQGEDLGFIPVKGGFKVFWWEDSFYALAEAGVGFPVTNDYSGNVDNTLILSPGIGWASKFVDLSLRYEHYTDFPTAEGGTGVGQVALRLAYGFKI